MPTVIAILGLVFKEGKVLGLAFSDCTISNISLDDCMFENIDITDADPKGVSINRSVIVRVAGITSREHVPPWVTDCLFESFQSTYTLAQIREAGLSVAQTFLLSSLRKLFCSQGAAGSTAACTRVTVIRRARRSVRR